MSEPVWPERSRTVPAGTPIEEATAKIIDAAGKGKLALLVTDAAGNVIIGLQATGGLTDLRHRPGDNLWTFAGAFGGTPVVLEGSVVLGNALGTEADQALDDFEPARPPGWEYTRQRMASRPSLPERKPYQRPQISGPWGPG